MSLATVVDLLRCPRCQQRVTLTESVLGCDRGHRFDLARQGYVNLLGSAQPDHADSASMIAAREQVLAAGRYAPVRDGLIAAIPVGALDLLDIGTGSGYYPSGVLAARPVARCLGIDVSVAGCRRAARAHPRLGVITADAWARLPVADRRVDAVLSVFAPRNPTEFSRVLRVEGVIITVTPGLDHLAELRTAFGLIGLHSAKEQRLTDSLGEAGFFATERIPVVRRDPWAVQDALQAVAMGPNAFHRDPGLVADLAARLTWPRTVTLSCVITRWSRRD
ncbi:MAG: methyltransferase domain-containing protein [Microlunatus sp.]|nr:methyltransferase domain-containing protein [Microlunatus sp.]